MPDAEAAAQPPPTVVQVAGPVYWGDTAPTNPVIAWVKVL